MPDLADSLTDTAAPRLPRLLGLAWLHFANDGAANLLPGILPAILISLHQSPALASGMMAALLIGQALQPALGWLADRLGGRSFILWGLGGTSLGAATIGVVPNFWLLILVLICIGLANSAFHPQALAAARRLAGPGHGLSMSVFLVGGELGRGIWPLLASLVVVHWGMQNLWVLMIAAFVSMALLHRNLPNPAPRPHAGKIAWCKHLPAASYLVTFSALRFLAIVGLVTYLPISWHAHGGSLVGGASLISVLLVVGIIGNIGGGFFADRLNSRLLLGASSILVAAFLALYLILPIPWGWPTLAALGIVLFASLPVTVLIGQDIFPENPSLGSGIALGFSNGLGAIMLLGFGAAVQLLGVDRSLWVIVLLTVISAPLAFALPRLHATRAG